MTNDAHTHLQNEVCNRQRRSLPDSDSNRIWCRVDLLRHLSFFTSVAETQHFGEAAYRLGMTQPPLSQGLQRLERHLGVRLFDRDARRVQITPAGQELLPAALELLRLSTAFTTSARDVATPEVLRVGACLELEDCIAPVLASAASTGLQVVPHVASSKVLAAALHNGELDAAVLRHPGVTDGLLAGAIHCLSTRIALPPGMQPASMAAVDLPVAVLPRHFQPSAHDQFVDALRRVGHSGDIRECATVAEAAALVAVGSAVRLTPSLDLGDGDSRIPMRVRVVLAPRRVQRQGLDYDEIARLLERVFPE